MQPLFVVCFYFLLLLNWLGLLLIFKLYKMNKFLIILALETLLEQVKDSNEIERVKEIKKQINLIKNY